jgi:hypothetical protein
MSLTFYKKGKINSSWLAGFPEKSRWVLEGGKEEREESGRGRGMKWRDEGQGR